MPAQQEINAFSERVKQRDRERIKIIGHKLTVLPIDEPLGLFNMSDKLIIGIALSTTRREDNDDGDQSFDQITTWSFYQKSEHAEQFAKVFGAALPAFAVWGVDKKVADLRDEKLGLVKSKPNDPNHPDNLVWEWTFRPVMLDVWAHVFYSDGTHGVVGGEVLNVLMTQSKLPEVPDGQS